MKLVIAGTVAATAIVTFSPTPIVAAINALRCAAVYQPMKYQGGAAFDWLCRNDGRCRATYASSGDGGFFEDRYYYSRGCIIRNVYVPTERFDVLQSGIGSDVQ